MLFLFCGSYTLIEPPDVLWGTYLKGNWTGITGQFHRKVRGKKKQNFWAVLFNKLAIKTEYKAVWRMQHTHRWFYRALLQSPRFLPSTFFPGVHHSGLQETQSGMNVYIKPFKILVCPISSNQNQYVWRLSARDRKKPEDFLCVHKSLLPFFVVFRFGFWFLHQWWWHLLLWQFLLEYLCQRPDDPERVFKSLTTAFSSSLELSFSKVCSLSPPQIAQRIRQVEERMNKISCFVTSFCRKPNKAPHTYCSSGICGWVLVVVCCSCYWLIQVHFFIFFSCFLSKEVFSLPTSLSLLQWQHNCFSDCGQIWASIY